jgi:biotin carboxylase
MNRKCILIVGAGHNQVGIIQKARSMGLETVAVDGNPAAPGFPHADHAVAINITDPEALAEAALRFRADGLYVSAELAVEATAVAARRLGLPGPTPDAATRVRDKHAMRVALKAAGLPVPAFRGTMLPGEAAEAAKAIGYPVVVKPSDSNASRGVQRVDSPGDMPAAFARALAESRRGVVLVEEYIAGEEYGVDGLMHEGRYIMGGITEKDRSTSPNRFDLGVNMPPRIPRAESEAIALAAASGLLAAGYTHGTTHVEVFLSARGPMIVEMAGRPGGGRIPTDLVPLSYGMDFMADSIRLALGEAPVETRRFERGSAIFWIPAETGQVRGIEGVEAARALPGVHEVVVNAAPGDTLDPVIDCVTRDKVGYVLTSGDTADAAVATARAALDLCRVVTRPLEPAV